MNNTLLNQYIHQFAISVMADRLNMTIEELTAKLNGKDDIFATEVINLTKLLNIPNPTEVFFGTECKKLDLSKIPSFAEVNRQKKSESIINDAMATVTDVLTRLEKPTTFLYDTLNDFFDHYEELENKDVAELTCMWYSAQHYKVYIESVLEYILNISKILNSLNHTLEESHADLFRDAGK